MYDFHLHLARFDAPLALAKELFQAGIGFNTIACEPWEWDASLKLIEAGLNVPVAFGLHPMVCSKNCSSELEQLENILQKHPQSELGECGLDKRFEGYGPAGIQERQFKRQVEMALEWTRPLHIHCVGDYGRILQLLSDAEKDSQKSLPRVILHRFGGDVSTVRRGLKIFRQRLLFSLHRDSFMKKSTVAALREIPADQVRFETDGDESFQKKYGDSAAAIQKQLAETQGKFLQLRAVSQG